MKKLLLLALIVLSCFAFASCDAVEQFVPGLNLGGSKELPISEEEWFTAAAETNYSYVTSRYKKEGGELVEESRISGKRDGGNHRKIVNIDGEPSFETCYTTIDGVAYEINDYHNGNGFVAEELSDAELTESEPRTLFINEYRASLYYSYLSYQGDNKYIVKYPYSANITETYEIEIVDGKIVSMVYTETYSDNTRKTVTTYFDISTTVVEIPEYTFADDNNDSEEVRTTITEEEWNAQMLITNYTVLTSYMEDTWVVDYHDSERLLEGFISSSNTDTLIEPKYVALIDGVQYNISKQPDSSWLAKESLLSYLPSTLGSEILLNQIEYADLVYDEVSKTYSAKAVSNDKIIDVIFAFVDGVLINAECSLEGEVVIKFYDIGTTATVELPEFTFAE